MKKHYVILLLCVMGAMVHPLSSSAQTKVKQASVKISGEVTTPMEIKLADMAQFEQTNVIRKDKDGKDRIYTGVLLSTILQKAGVSIGKELKGKDLTKYILAEASDGYQVAFALAELDKDLTDRQIILATQMDGKPLPDADGPFRIIV